MSIFDIEKIEARMKELKDLPPFRPEKSEMRFTSTQFFEDTGMECTLSFVIRNGEMIIYDSKTYKP